MSRYISRYVSTCDMCLCTKASWQSPVGELPIPNAPWDTISVDFIVKLPESEGKDAVMVVVDSLTKCGHFVDMVTTLSAAGTARLYVQHIWKHHSLPKKVVSDRGPLMRSHNPYPWKLTFYWLFLPNGTWSVTILMTSTPTWCLPYISLKTPLHICHPPQLWCEVLVWGLYCSKLHYYSELSEHWVFHCAVHIISSDFYLY